MSTDPTPPSRPPLSSRIFGAGPGILLAHGAGSDIDDSFGPITERLAERYTVVAPDYPGSGATPSRNEPLDPDELADLLVDAADRAGLPTFAIVGFSTGAAVAIRAATRYPNRVEALVLCAGFAAANPRLRLVADTWRSLMRSGEHAELAAYLVLLGWSSRWLDQQAAAAIQDLTAAIVPALPEGTEAQLDLLSRIDVRADLPALNLPVLIIAAAHDNVVSPAHAAELRAGIPEASFVMLDSGHTLAAERPDEWAAAISDFVGTVTFSPTRSGRTSALPTAGTPESHPGRG